MYSTLLVFHSFFRWLVLAFLLVSIYQSIIGLRQLRAFSKWDNFLRHSTATISHIQLSIGIILYIKSPIVKYFWSDFDNASQYLEITFFGLIHFVLMIIAVLVITIGSALAKRKKIDQEKYKTMLIWFIIALFIIFIAIPWPFSPLANRPYMRSS